MSSIAVESLSPEAKALFGKPTKAKQIERFAAMCQMSPEQFRQRFEPLVASEAEPIMFLNGAPVDDARIRT